MSIILSVWFYNMIYLQNNTQCNDGKKPDFKFLGEYCLQKKKTIWLRTVE